MAVAFNNPYTAVIRGHAADYFASGAVSPYRTLWAMAIKTYHHHRTLEDYLAAFLDAGLRLTRLADLTGMAVQGLPRFMLLGLAKE